MSDTREKHCMLPRTNWKNLKFINYINKYWKNNKKIKIHRISQTAATCSRCAAQLWSSSPVSKIAIPCQAHPMSIHNRGDWTKNALCPRMVAEVLQCSKLFIHQLLWTTYIFYTVCMCILYIYTYLYIHIYIYGCHQCSTTWAKPWVSWVQQRAKWWLVFASKHQTSSWKTRSHGNCLLVAGCERVQCGWTAG